MISNNSCLWQTRSRACWIWLLSKTIAMGCFFLLRGIDNAINLFWCAILLFGSKLLAFAIIDISALIWILSKEQPQTNSPKNRKVNWIDGAILANIKKLLLNKYVYRISFISFLDSRNHNSLLKNNHAEIFHFTDKFIEIVWLRIFHCILSGNEHNFLFFINKYAI